jgi:hypothetical protein
MCLIITQIMEVEEKLANAQTDGERALYEHELERLEAEYDAKYKGDNSSNDAMKAVEPQSIS